MNSWEESLWSEVYPDAIHCHERETLMKAEKQLVPPLSDDGDARND
jgi:hypothetical protein